MPIFSPCISKPAIRSYRLFNYSGGLTDNGLNLGTVPVAAGLVASIDTSTLGQVNLNVSAVPEPSSIALAAMGLVGLVAVYRRRRK